MPVTWYVVYDNMIWTYLNGAQVPYDQPENALDMFSRWLKNEALNEIKEI